MLVKLPVDTSTTRVRPSPGVGLAVFVGYMVAVVALIKVFAGDINYQDFAKTADNFRSAILIPIGIVSVLLAVVTTWLGWWRPVLFEERTTPKWMLVIPIVAVLGPLVTIATSDHLGEFSTTHLLYLIIGFAFVGFSEELMTRGILLVGFRSEWKELLVYIAVTLCFGMMHGLNIFFGQDLTTTVTQMVGTLAMASVLYAARRTSGTLLAAMLVHALFDLSLMLSGGVAADTNDLSREGPVGISLAISISAIAFLIGIRHMFGSRSRAADVPAESAASEPKRIEDGR
jgi:hypothetical protein